MTDRARNMRTLRHANEPSMMVAFSRTRVGKSSTPGQVKAAARLVLRNYTAKLPR